MTAKRFVTFSKRHCLFTRRLRHR